MKLLIELPYLGSVSWYLAALRYRHVVIEAHENFEKSTYRNRCHITGPDGLLRLSIPLEHGRGQRSKYKDIKISNEYNWQKNHWSGFCACYRSSPFFEFYEHHFHPFYHQQFDFLFDYNRQLMELMFQLLNVSLQIEYSSEYTDNPPEDVMDFRSVILPQLPRFDAQAVQYRQVFQERTGFIQDACIVDLLFNEGPRAGEKLDAVLEKQVNPES